MIRVRSGLVWAAVAILIFIAIGLVALAASTMMSAQSRMGRAVDLPLSSQAETKGRAGSVGQAILESEGAVRLDGFPIGVVLQAEGKCTDWDGKTTFSGAGTWTIDNDLIITITTSRGDVAIGPYHPARGDVVWYRFGLPLCGSKNPLWYWVS